MASIFAVTRVGSFVPRRAVKPNRANYVVMKVDLSVSCTLDRKINVASSANKDLLNAIQRALTFLGSVLYVRVALE